MAEEGQTFGQRELLVATRAALRGLPALYVEVDRGRCDSAEALAAELFCLIGLHGSCDQSGVPARSELSEFAFRVLASLFAATQRVRESSASVAAYSVCHGAMYGGSSELIGLVAAQVEISWQDIASGGGVHHLLPALVAADRELVELGAGSETLQREPVWGSGGSNLQLASVLDQVRAIATAGSFGHQRWSAFYDPLIASDLLGADDIGRALRMIIDEVGPPKPVPGENAVYGPGAVYPRVRQVPRMRDASVLHRAERIEPPFRVSPPPAVAVPPSRLSPGVEDVSEEREYLAASSERVVNTGFAYEDSPSTPLSTRESLPHGAELLFWLEVGEYLAGVSAEATPVGIPWEKLPDDAELTVVLFGFDDGAEVCRSIGVLRLDLSGEVVVVRQPMPSDRVPQHLLHKRLLFPVVAPKNGAQFKLRCSIYCHQVLVQSRVLEATLGEGGEAGAGGFSSTLDYNLTRSLRPETLAGLGEHALSVMLNDGHASHQFRFFGKSNEPFASSVDLGEDTLSDLLDLSRAAFRKVAWGNANAWTNEAYRYDALPSLAQLEADLITLAVAGYRCYDALVGPLVRDAPDAAEKLTAAMRRTGRVQFTARRSPRELVPAALMYDHALDTNAPKLSLCPEFKSALASGQSLEAAHCFTHGCPHEADDTVVCPSGFWGFRHEIGIPVSLAKDGADLDAATTITAGPNAALTMCVATDPNFVRRVAHQEEVREFFDQTTWQFVDSRDDAKRLLAKSSAHVIYFYCHGGMNGTMPFILLGQGPGITRDNIRVFKWDWRKQRPLVFINGCHTTALEPSNAFDFVTAFIETAGASSVIGTEITVFEPLACAFAEAFLKRFVKARKELGAAVRLSRLELLQAGNPLGLVYLPFGVASLKLA